MRHCTVLYCTVLQCKALHSLNLFIVCMSELQGGRGAIRNRSRSKVIEKKKKAQQVLRWESCYNEGLIIRLDFISLTL